MSQDLPFTPQQHLFNEDASAPGMEDLGDCAYHLDDLENDFLLEVAYRRGKAAAIRGLGQQETPHLSEHLAWLLARETDALTAYLLYLAILSAHPRHWTLMDWQEETARSTPFPMLRRAILDDLSLEGWFDDEEPNDLVDGLDATLPEDRALKMRYIIPEHPVADNLKRQLIAMMRDDATFTEKVSAISAVDTIVGPNLHQKPLDIEIYEALRGLFEQSNHVGLDYMAAQALLRATRHEDDQAFLVFMINSFHVLGKAAAFDAVEDCLREVDSSFRDSWNDIDQPEEHLTTSLVNSFSKRAPVRGFEELRNAIMTISQSQVAPMSALSAVGWLADRTKAQRKIADQALDYLENYPNPQAQAIAIRILSKRPGALKPFRDRLFEMAIYIETPHVVRRAVFDALADAPRAGIGIKIRQIVNLFLTALQNPNFEQVSVSLHASDIAQASKQYVTGLAEVWPLLADEQPRLSALRLLAVDSDGGIHFSFEPYLSKVIDVLLMALSQPTEVAVHKVIFQHLLKDDELPAELHARLTTTLNGYLSSIEYAADIRDLIEEWLSKNPSANENST